MCAFHVLVDVQSHLSVDPCTCTSRGVCMLSGCVYLRGRCVHVLRVCMSFEGCVQAVRGGCMCYERCVYRL